MEKHKILLVDDEERILKSLRRLLRNEGYQITIVTSAEEGLKTLRNDTIDLVVSDYKMPEMDGLEFLKRVKKRFPGVIRIMLTGQADTTSAISAINEGEVYRFLTKPWQDEELKIMLRQALEFYDILKGAKGLLKKTECQSHLLKNLEFKYPGIAEENKQEGTAYIISEDEISSLESLVDKYSAL